VNITVDKTSSEPVYEQIRRQVEDLVRQGLLASGTRIPSVRELAQRLGVTKNTVGAAYDELSARRLIETRHGSGTFVTSQLDVVNGNGNGVNLHRRQEMATDLVDFPPMRWEPYFFSSDFFGMPRSRSHGDGLIRFTQAYPDPALFPFDRIKQVSANMLWSPKDYFFDLGNPQGYQPLVEYLEKEMALAGVPMAEGQNDIIITSGFQRALSLLLDFLVQPGQKVAIEAPCYVQLLNLLIAKRVGYVAIPVDSQGMDTEYLAGVLARGEVHAVITIPSFHNPTGVCMSLPRREHLLRLAMQHRVPIIEDDYGRHLRYEGRDDCLLKSLDPGGYVIHVGTFSKCFMPGLRLGWITCPSAIAVQLVRAKAGADHGDSYFLQALMYEFIAKGHFDRHLRRSRKEYKRRRDVLCDTLARCLPPECRFRVPQGGFSLWVELPEGMSSLQLLALAREAGVDFLPAAFMMPDRSDAPALRLSFARLAPEEIEQGARKLCTVIDDCIKRPDLLTAGFQAYKDLYG
jgi:DNA-binding transcriptional MocR family regulator